jgi:hypothetical protein
MATDAYNGGDIISRINAHLCPPVYSTAEQFIRRFRIETALANSHMSVRYVAGCMFNLQALACTLNSEILRLQSSTYQQCYILVPEFQLAMSLAGGVWDH